MGIALPYAAALAALAEAQRILDEAGSFSALDRVPPPGAAIAAFFRYAFAMPRDPRVAANPPTPAHWEIVALLLRRLDDRELSALLAGNFFRAPNPAVYDALASGLRGRISAAVAEACILAQLRSTDPLRRRNASELAYFLFDPRSYPLSASGREALSAGKRGPRRRGHKITTGY